MTVLPAVLSIVVLAVVLVLAVLAVGADLRAPGRVSRRSHGTLPAVARPSAPRARLESVPGELVLIQRLGPQRVGLDCLLGDPRAELGPGARTLLPVHVRARGTGIYCGSAPVEEIPMRWLAEGRRVSVEIRAWAGGAPVTLLSTGHSLVVLQAENGQDVAAQLDRVGRLTR